MSDQTDPTERKTNGGTDWERIATVLANKVVFAMRNLKARNGSGFLFSFGDNGEYVPGKHWKDDFADAIELIPGAKVDREYMHALDLPKRQREKFFAQRKESDKSKKDNESNEN